MTWLRSKAPIASKVKWPGALGAMESVVARNSARNRAAKTALSVKVNQGMRARIRPMTPGGASATAGTVTAHARAAAACWDPRFPNVLLTDKISPRPDVAHKDIPSRLSAR
jgi:hypothetical protein